MVQIAVNVILDHSIIINKQYYLCEKQLCTYSLLHFFADTAPLRREIASSRVFLENAKERRRGFLSFVYLECGF